jgi:hypothetical protein
MKKYRLRSRKLRLTGAGTYGADHATSSSGKFALTFLTSDGRSFGIRVTLDIIAYLTCVIHIAFVYYEEFEI